MENDSYFNAIVLVFIFSKTGLWSPSGEKYQKRDSMSELIDFKEHFDIRKMDIRSEVKAGKRYKGR